MTDYISISDAQLRINNETIRYKPNSLSYTEGLGEQNVRVQSAGGGYTEAVYSQDVEKNYSDVKFILYSTPENISKAREWKNNAFNNIISIVDNNGFTRTFARACLKNNYEVKLSSDGEIELEFCCEKSS